MEDQTAREEHLQHAALDIAGELLRISRKDKRYRVGAYEWLLSEGLAYTMSKHLGLTEQTRRHMTGRELAEGLRALAREQFGPLAREVWRYWSINTTRDWGEIVFNLINAGILQGSEEDRIEDFNNVFDVEAM